MCPDCWDLLLKGRLDGIRGQASDRHSSGGPAGTIYSFIIVWIGNLATFASLAELSSMSAGLLHPLTH